ncbi:MAG: hypothetical protein KC468_36280, partial [Myxococcales bacterium]|nr:hypothetical protein [Myxococcales bacterium]
MSLLHDAWVALRHGGNLLAPDALDGLPKPSKAPLGLADRLRSALVDLDPDKPGKVIGPLLDVVLEDVCGLRKAWEKGNALGAASAEKLLDGTVHKPRRRWQADGSEPLVVFSTTARRIGVGKGRRPVAQLVEYIRRRELPLGVLTNGTQWRLIWADTDSLAWVEWEADRWLTADQLADELEVLRQVLSPASLRLGDDGASPLLAAIRETRRGQARLSKELGERVRRSVETLLRSRAPLVGPAWGDHAANDLYVAASHFVMRLVVTLFAEARELLPVDNPVFYRAYGLRGLLDQLDRLTPERRRARYTAWPRLLALFRLLHRGSLHPIMTLPAYGGDLFAPGTANGTPVQRSLALLEALPEPPDDDVVHRILVLLTRTTQKVREGSGWRTVAAPVDFTELTSEYIGILYEGLLDYELHRAGDEPIVFLSLGDQPALPLDRLEAMDDKALKALVEKAKIKKQADTQENDDDNGDEEDEPDESDPDGDRDGDAEDEATIEDDDNTPNDARAQARARALAWGRRAAEVAKLVKKPKGKKADAHAQYLADLDRASAQLIADLKLPGELYLVRWGGTRKGAGTFYTRPQLTLPTVRRTLEPLINEGDAEKADQTVRPPEALLSLKVCDPAMGSGSFLVAALRVLTLAVVKSLHVHGRIKRVNGRTTVACELLPEADRSLQTEGFEERLEAIVRRAVVEHCIYGVDLDPLAVELARVALWVETLDKRLPFTFLDHKLRCGDALVGTWLDRFRDYPLLCFSRQSPDKKYKGVHHKADVWHNALKKKRTAAISEQVSLLSSTKDWLRPGPDDEELKAAVERVRRLYRDLRAVPAGRPDERARIWRERIQTDEALSRVREAFDTWCALWFWPIDQLDVIPLPSDLPAPSEAARAVVKVLRDTKRFIHWELEFPDVFTEEGAGFDAVVGNPPWEIQKPNSKEFFSNHDPLYRAYGKQEALRVQKNLFKARPFVEDQWLAYNGDFKDRGNFVKHGAEPFGDGKVHGHGGGDVSLVRGKRGAALHKTWRGRRARYRGLCDPEHPFRHQGSADLNTYKMFVEQAHALLGKGGQLGLVVPSGIYTDKGTGELRTLLLKRCIWRWLYGFENRNKLFDIHRSFKFCVLIAAKGGRTGAIQAAFMRRDLEDWTEAKTALAYPAERVTSFSPTSLSVLEIRSDKDLEVLTKLYSNGVLLGDDGPDGWGIKYAREFDMTNDSKLFIARDKAEVQGFRPDIYGRWVNDVGTVLLPLYEGRMIGQFDFSEKGWVSGKGRSAEWREVPWENKRIEPQYLMPTANWLNALTTGRDDKARMSGTKLTFMAIGSATNRRSMIAALVRDVPCGNAVPVLQPNSKVIGALSMVASMNSLAFDFGLRAKLGGLNLNYFVISETTLTPPETALPPVIAATAKLCLAHLWFAPTWIDLDRHSQAFRVPPSAWALTPHERLRLRAMLDAIVAALYGLGRDDFAWILKDCDHPAVKLSDSVFCRQLDSKGFWRVDKTDDPELRHTVLSLAAFDDLQSVIAATGGNRDAGIQAFCDQHDGDGWM